MRSIKTASTNQITVQKAGTTSGIVITLPRDIALSTPPMSGFFKIKCALDKDGTLWNETIDMNQISASNDNIRDNIIKACPIYRDNIEVFSGPQYSYFEDGRDFMIRFVGLNYDVPQMEVLPSVD
jgi:hypothetical protein